MFDIKEYYNEDKFESLRQDIEDIDGDISFDVENILHNRLNSLYHVDRYKFLQRSVDIIYPRLMYPGNSGVILTPDRVRFLLSFYPNKNDFENIEKILIKPKYIEIANVELVSLYLRRKKILVLYLCHPHLYRVNISKLRSYFEFDVTSIEKYIGNNLMSGSVEKKEESHIHVSPLWYILSLIYAADDDKIDKFMIRIENMNDALYGLLNDVSFFYTRHGY